MSAYRNAKPYRVLDWRESPDGRCILLRPKFGSSRLGLWLATRTRDPHYRIRLDDVGTLVWKACDGETALSTIAEELRNRFGHGIEPAEQRLAVFVQRMLRSKMLAVERPIRPGRDS